MPWTNIPKPTEASIYGITGGEPIGMLLALTKSALSTSVVSGWSGIAKPTSSVWTAVGKPTTQAWTKISKPT